MTLQYGDPDGRGRYGILDVIDGRFLCHECGRTWALLTTHLRYEHGILAAAYRDAHGLDPRTSLAAPALRERRAPRGVCAFEGCDKPHYVSGYCNGHYSQMRKGQPLRPLRARTSPENQAARYAEIVRLWDQGHSLDSIRRQVNCGEETARAALQDVGRAFERRMPKTAPHGAPGRWAAGCDCAECQAGKTAYKAAERAREIARVDLESLPHGRTRSYNLGCRCTECVTAAREQLRERQAQTVPTARSHGAQWTGPAVDHAMRLDLSINQVARDLGRTYAAVSNVRAAIANPHDISHHRYKILWDDYLRTTSP